MATNVLRRALAGWDGCCANRGQAAVMRNIRRNLIRGLPLPKILNLIVLIPNADGVARFRQCHVELLGVRASASEIRQPVSRITLQKDRTSRGALAAAFRNAFRSSPRSCSGYDRRRSRTAFMKKPDAAAKIFLRNKFAANHENSEKCR